MKAKIIAIIPARGGSKRLPRKNLMWLAGKPLLAHSIDVARASDLFDRICVSTDAPEIAETAEGYGAEVPFRRPQHLATDQATVVDACLHALGFYEAQGCRYNFFCMLQPTSPLRSVEDIHGTYRLLRFPDIDFAVTITAWEHPPFWAFELQDNRIVPYWDVTYLRKTQELPNLWRPAGSVVFARTGAFRRARTFYTDRTAGYPVPRERAIDIDDELDLNFAEYILGAAEKGGARKTRDNR